MKGNSKESSTYHAIALISLANNIMLKIFQIGFNSMWTENFQVYKLDLEKGKEPEIKFQHPLDHRENKGIPENISICLTDYAVLGCSL